MLNLLANLPFTKFIIGGLMAALLASGGYILYSNHKVTSLQRQIEHQVSEIIQLNNELYVQKKLVEITQSTQRILDDRIRQERINAEALQERLKEIEDATEDQNGPVSDVLRDSIGRLPNYKD